MIAICIALIGLGIPDSLFGTARPAIREEFGLPIFGMQHSGSFSIMCLCAILLDLVAGIAMQKSDYLIFSKSVVHTHSSITGILFSKLMVRQMVRLPFSNSRQ